MLAFSVYFLFIPVECVLCCFECANLLTSIQFDSLSLSVRWIVIAQVRIVFRLFSTFLPNKSMAIRAQLDRDAEHLSNFLPIDTIEMRCQTPRSLLPQIKMNETNWNLVDLLLLFHRQEKGVVDSNQFFRSYFWYIFFFFYLFFRSCPLFCAYNAFNSWLSCITQRCYTVISSMMRFIEEV